MHSKGLIAVADQWSFWDFVVSWLLYQEIDRASPSVMPILRDFIVYFYYLGRDTCKIYVLILFDFTSTIEYQLPTLPYRALMILK